MPSGVSSSGGSVAHCVRECHLGVLYYKKPILVYLRCDLSTHSRTVG